MDVKGILLVLIGIIIFSASFVFSYETPDIQSIVQYIMWISGFTLIIIGAYLMQKSEK